MSRNPSTPEAGPSSAGQPSPQLGDELPDDLVPSAARGKYSVPDNARRRRPAGVFLVAGLASLALWARYGDGGVLVNEGILAAGIGFLLLAGYFLVSSRGVRVWEEGAIATAKQVTGLTAGSGRAQLAWRGLLGSPVWRVLVHDESADPVRRGVVIVDATDGSIVEHMTQDVAPDQ